MLTCEVAERLIADALYDELAGAQHDQLHQHLKRCQPCRDLLVELKRANGFLEANGVHADRLSGIGQRTSLKAVWDSMQPALDWLDAARIRQTPRWHITPYLTGALATAASLVVVFVFFDLRIVSGDTAVETVSPVLTDDSSHAALMSYLRRAEALLMTLANAQSQTGAGIPIRGPFARNMAQEAVLLTANMEDRFSAGQSQLLEDIEYLLTQIADLDEVDARNGIRMLQDYIEENDILFRIRLMTMREVERMI